MAAPTIARRLERRFIVLSSDESFREQVLGLAPAGWEMRSVADLEEIGDWNEILLFRFLVLDADDPSIDAVETVQRLRTEWMLQVAVICFGGDSALRDDLRLARADRFFDKDALPAVLPAFFQQYGW